MKTMFSRQFALTAALLLSCLVVLGLALRIFLGSYTTAQTKNTLSSNAEAVADLASSFDSAMQVSVSWDVRINLSFASQVADTEAMICDESGYVILCSCSPLYCEHIGMQVDPAFIANVLENGQMSSSHGIQGLHGDAHYLVAQPIVSRITGQAIGVVIVSSSMEQARELISKMVDFFLMTGLAILLLSMLAVSRLAHSQCQPLGDMAAAARRFGHGELGVRVETGGSNPIEIDELAVAFNNMAASLEKSELQRQEFVANISHELKTPMTTIAGFMDGMLDGTIPQERHREYMQTVADEVRRLSRLVRSMLEISRLQSQGIPNSKKQVFNLCEQAGQTLLNFERRINDRQLEVEVLMPEEPVEVFAEMDSITQVIYNLIDNAVKFCPPGGTLGLSIQPGETKVLVTVSNTGPTIPPEELPRIFDRFHKTDKSRSMDRDGVGLGLYIVKTIILGHGEDISVTSREGVTRFTFTLSPPK